MGRVSLLGAKLARPGQEFVFWHRCEVAERCPVAAACQNLRLGHRYRVAATRPVRHDVCTEHEEGVQAVEVEELAVETNLPATLLRGTRIRWTPLVCIVRGCPRWDACFNPALVPQGDYAVREDQGAVPCPMGYSLRHVRLEQVGDRPGRV